MAEARRTKMGARVRDTKVKNQLGKEKVGDRLGKNKPGTLTRTATAAKGATGVKAGMRQRRIRNVRSA